jgi:hypothetical protein
VAGRSTYRDHHWFRAHEIATRAAPGGSGARHAAPHAKDAVRWPEGAARDGAAVLEVQWDG